MHNTIVATSCGYEPNAIRRLACSDNNGEEESDLPIRTSHSPAWKRRMALRLDLCAIVGFTIALLKLCPSGRTEKVRPKDAV